MEKVKFKNGRNNTYTPKDIERQSGIVTQRVTQRKREKERERERERKREKGKNEFDMKRD